MPTQADVRRIALALPRVSEEEGRFAFSVEHKGNPRHFAWVWLERLDPKKARVPNPSVLAISVPNVAHREAMIAAEPDKFFTEPHYANYPAVLVRLDVVSKSELKTLLEEGHACRAMPAPKVRSRTRASRTSK